ncbi:MAG: adenosylcobinamide amidohydrolase [Deltaproteobacteria bacterium]|jgi:adenosylcobinamide amidohydrolase|nr:adenosylcobinamide amidohydrolase [Deltaproteobacteria bacterium]
MKRQLLAMTLLLLVIGLALPVFAGPAQEDPDLPEILAQKVAKLPQDKLKTTVFVEPSPNGLKVAGTGSVLAAIILKAGGVLPTDLGALEWVEVNGAAFRKLNPSVVVIRTKDKEALGKLFKGGGYRNAPAIKNGDVFDFPDGLVDQAKDYQTYFAAWLAGTLYPNEFAKVENLVRPQEVLAAKPLKLDMPYVESAAIVDSRLLDFVHRTLLIRFKRPMDIISTNSGALKEIESVGNSFSPSSTWPIYHLLGYEGPKTTIYDVLKLDKAKASIMGTGADLNNLVVTTRKYKDLAVTTLITAGVEGNAIRAGSDVGAYFEPGTINIIVLTNRHLSPGAMANAIIYVTEAKTAALWEMDIRSVQTGLENPATGTGTDTVIVVSGEGKSVNYSGGHTKIGQLIAEAVKAGVTEAILKQNGKTKRRTVKARLAERCLYYPELASILTNPRYQGFVELAFSLSDAYRFEQAVDLTAFESLALTVASEIAGKPVLKLDPENNPESKGSKIPPPLSIALRALMAGQKSQ